MITDKEWNETMELLQGLYGNAEDALKFHNNIPLDKSVTNGTIHIALMIQQKICRHCRNEQIFTGCPYYVKRLVDSCEGAFSEVKKEDLDGKSSIWEACKLKVQQQVGLIMDDRR